MQETQTKTCGKCRQTLALYFFNECSKGTYGKQGYCRDCQKNNRKKDYEKNKSEQIIQRIEWRQENREKDRLSCKRWKENNPTTYEKGWRNYNQKYRVKVLDIVGRGVLKCIRCGCDEVSFLEINHKNGGGRKETLNRNQHFYCSIISGKRTIDDLELLCKPCNAIHYLELKTGRSLPYNLKWEKSNG